MRWAILGFSFSAPAKARERGGWVATPKWSFHLFPPHLLSREAPSSSSSSFLLCTQPNWTASFSSSPLFSHECKILSCVKCPPPRLWLRGREEGGGKTLLALFSNLLMGKLLAATRNFPFILPSFPSRPFTLILHIIQRESGKQKREKKRERDTSSIDKLLLKKHICLKIFFISLRFMSQVHNFNNDTISYVDRSAHRWWVRGSMALADTLSLSHPTP